MNDLNSNKKNHKRQRVIEAASQVFAQKGYNKSRMSDIAQVAEIGKSTIYEYFSAKSELFMAVFKWLSEEYQNKSIIHFSSDQSSVETLRQLILKRAEIFGEMEGHYNLMMEFWAATATSDLRENLKQAFADGYKNDRKIYIEIINQGIQKGEFKKDIDPIAVSAGLCGTIEGIFLQAWFSKNLDPNQITKNYMTSLLEGLKAPN